MSSDGQTRRRFCARVCAATGLVGMGGVLGALLEGCGGNPAGASPDVQFLPTVDASLDGTAVSIPITSSSPLASVGSAALVETPGGSFLVAQVAQGSFMALTARCTHQGCTITKFGNGVYVCPCHGSEFSTSGQVLNGPASLPLEEFQADFASGVLTLTV